MVGGRRATVTKILVVDDHAIFRQGFISVLQEYAEFEIVGQATNGVEAVEKAIELQPDVVIMDVCMPGGDGVEATTAIQQSLPQVNVLILTVSEEENDLFNAIKAGAKGYLLKNVSLQELIDSIRLVASGEAIIAPSMAVRLLNEFRQAEIDRAGKALSELTDREKEVLQQITNGSSNKEIAAKLYISETTVKAHLRSILEKLHVRNRAQAAALAMAKGLLK